MAKQTTKEVNEPAVQTPQIKRVRNRNDYKVELLIDGNVVVFPPKKTVEIPANFDVPSNLGLYNV